MPELLFAVGVIGGMVGLCGCGIQFHRQRCSMLRRGKRCAGMINLRGFSVDYSAVMAYPATPFVRILLAGMFVLFLGIVTKLF